MNTKRNKINVFIIDDSATARKVLSKMLSSAPDIEVTGSALNPIFAMRKMEKCWPDVIILDVLMPQMDGITFLKKLMKERPTRVVMCSSLTETGADITIEALTLGAAEVIAKPKRNVQGFFEGLDCSLVDVVRAAAKTNLNALKNTVNRTCNVPPKLTADAILPKQSKSTTTDNARKIVAIGASTGGTQALERVLSKLPKTVPGIVIVQHMPEKYTNSFAARLNDLCEVNVKEAGDKDRITAGQALIAPGGRHMLMKTNDKHEYYISIEDGPKISRHRPSVDVLFRSVANISGRNTLGIIMTGMGDDGASGLKDLRDTGALTIGQDQDSCVVYGMPAMAKKRGAVIKEITLDSIAGEIMHFAESRVY